MVNKYSQGALGRLQSAITLWSDTAKAKCIDLPAKVPPTFVCSKNGDSNEAARRFLWLLDQKKLPFHPLGFVGWSPVGQDLSARLQVEYFAIRPSDLKNDAHWALAMEHWRAIQQYVLDEIVRSAGSDALAKMSQEGEENFVWRINGAAVSSCRARKWNSIVYWHGTVLQEPSFSEALASQPTKKV